MSESPLDSLSEELELQDAEELRLLVTLQYAAVLDNNHANLLLRAHKVDAVSKAVSSVRGGSVSSCLQASRLANRSARSSSIAPVAQCHARRLRLFSSS